jgi:hypothetical protein
VNLIEETFRKLIPESELNVFKFTMNGQIENIDFIKELKKQCNSILENDRIILYFTGHGEIDYSDNHYLCATNTANFETGIELLYVIEIISGCDAKSKLIILDCCHADNPKTHNLESKVEDTISESFGKGCSIFSSSTINESSYPFSDDKKYSAFTRLLCNALNDKHIFNKGYVYFNDVQNLVAIYFEMWSKKNQLAQRPIFRSSCFGTFVLPVKDYNEPEEVSIRPIHISDSIRIMDIKSDRKNNDYGEYSLYQSLAVIVEPNHKSDLTSYVKEVATIVKKFLQTTGTNFNIMWLYVAHDLIDYDNNNWKYIIRNSDKYNTKWLRINNSTVINAELTYQVQPNYESNRKERLEYTMSNKDLINYWDENLSELIVQIDPLIKIYQSYKLEDIDRDTLCKSRNDIAKVLSEKLYEFDNARFPEPFSSLKKFDETCYELANELRGIVIALPKKRSDFDELNTYNIEKSVSDYYSLYHRWSKFRKEIDKIEVEV